MKFRELVLSHIVANPGCTSGDIHQRFLTYSVSSIKRCIRELNEEKRIWREKAGNEYRYAVVGAEMPKSMLTKNEEKIKKLDAKLRHLLDMGFNRRAGTLCLELIDLSRTDGQRQYYTSLRSQCLRHRTFQEGV
jgi:hypothetical protein